MLAGSLMCCIDVTERRAMKKSLLQKEESLAAKSRSVEDMKAAIRVLLEFRAQHEAEQKQQMLANLGQTLLPWIERLKRTRLDAEQKVCVEIIESQMVDIASSFAGIISSKVPSLTRTEMQVAELVKLGKTSKEIASLLGVSKECIDFHRNNLRKKFGLSKQKVNLSSHLCSFSQ
jgi:DNA-binding CsgD family transcriptional regulator